MPGVTVLLHLLSFLLEPVPSSLNLKATEKNNLKQQTLTLLSSLTICMQIFTAFFSTEQTTNEIEYHTSNILTFLLNVLNRVLPRLVPLCHHLPSEGCDLNTSVSEGFLLSLSSPPLHSCLLVLLSFSPCTSLSTSTIKPAEPHSKSRD